MVKRSQEAAKQPTTQQTKRGAGQPPKIDGPKLNENKRPFETWGVDFVRTTGYEAIGNCPFCSKENHFFVNLDTTQWNCKRCGEDGNLTTFLERVLAYLLDQTSKEDYARLETLRGLPAKTFKRNQFAWDSDGMRWTFPTRNGKGTITDLRHWKEDGGAIYATAGCKLGLWNAQALGDVTTAGQPVWVCEGEWDGVALDWLRGELNLKLIAVAVPGAGTFKTDWLPLLADRTINLAYDHDGAGEQGERKAQAKLTGIVRSINYVKWPQNAPDGYDLRDYITDLLGEGISPKGIWGRLKGLVVDCPRWEVPKRPKSSPAPNDSDHAGGHGTNGFTPERSAGAAVLSAKRRRWGVRGSFERVNRAYSEWLTMTPDLTAALQIVMASVLGPQIKGDPLWFWLVGAPGSGKTVLLSPLRKSESCVFRSTLTPNQLISGFNSETDPSLIPKLAGKTLVLKDATELLSQPTLFQEQIFSVLRGAYDGYAMRSWGSPVTRVYEGIHFGFLAAVTSIIHSKTHAAMGERCLKFQLSTGTQQKREAVIRGALLNIGQEDAMDEELGDVVQEFLEQHANIDITDRVPIWAIDRIIAISQITAKLRAEVVRDFRTDQIIFKPEAELGTRLAKQLTKLAALLCCVKDLPELDEATYSLVERVAFDTSIGWNLDIVQALMNLHSEKETDEDPSLNAKEIISLTNLPAMTVSRRLEELTMLEVLDRVTVKGAAKAGKHYLYRVAPEIQSLWANAEIVERKQYLRTLKAKRKS